MRRKILTLVAIAVLFAGFASAQVGKGGPSAPAQRLTKTATTVSENPVLAISGTTWHAAYIDDGKFYYRRNPASGAAGSWESEQWLAVADVNTWNRSIDICANGSYVYIVMSWRQSGTSDDFEIWFMRSTNDGVSWSEGWQRLTFNTGESKRPKLACSGSYVYVIWQDDNPGNMEIFLKRNTNNGDNGYWSGPMRLTYSAGSSHYPVITAAGLYVYVAWQDDNPGNNEIFFKRSNNYALSFGPVWRVTYNSGFSWNPTLICDSSGQYVHVAWSDNNPGNYEVFYKRNTNYGTSGGWSGPRRMSYTAGDSRWQDIDCSGSTVDLVWSDSNPGNYEIIGKYSGDNGSSWTSAQRWTYNAGSSLKPSVISSVWDIIWQDNNPGNYEIFFKR